jgi:hypothetical protein
LSLINQSVRFDNGLFGKDLSACAKDVTNSFSTKAKFWRIGSKNSVTYLLHPNVAMKGLGAPVHKNGGLK